MRGEEYRWGYATREGKGEEGAHSTGAVGNELDHAVVEWHRSIWSSSAPPPPPAAPESSLPPALLHH